MALDGRNANFLSRGKPQPIEELISRGKLLSDFQWDMILFESELGGICF